MVLVNKIKSLFQKKAVVLMYHRIDSVTYDPWRLCVTQENFMEQLDTLKKNYDIISVAQLIQELKEGRVINNAVCITFDDGYADNYLLAKPALEAYACPATFFIATNYTGTSQLFWWDLLEEIILGSTFLPGSISINIQGNPFNFRLKDTPLTPLQIAEQQKWVWPSEPPNDRCKLYLALWEQLLPLEYEEIGKVIRSVAEWSGYTPQHSHLRLPMTMEQLASLSSNSLFDLGFHTASHADLSCHSQNYQEHEMGTCKKQLTQHFSNPVNAISFPYGRYNESTLKAMMATGIEAGFTTAGKSIKKNSDILTLGRMHVGNWNGETFGKILKNWFNYS